MDNNPLTPRTTSNFSIASLITSDYCNDENNLYNPMTNPIETNFNFNNCSIDKITNDFYPNSIQQDLHHFHSDTLIETNNEQYQQPIKRKENRSKLNLQKTFTTTGHMEG